MSQETSLEQAESKSDSAERSKKKIPVDGEARALHLGRHVEVAASNVCDCRPLLLWNHKNAEIPWNQLMKRQDDVV